jgi:hypothetical protein
MKIHIFIAFKNMFKLKIYLGTMRQLVDLKLVKNLCVGFASPLFLSPGCEIHPKNEKNTATSIRLVLPKVILDYYVFRYKYSFQYCISIQHWNRPMLCNS